MSNNSSPCMTCALRVTARHIDAEAATHAHNVFLQFKRHHPKSFRVHDLTGPKEENTTWFCILGDKHFNKDNAKCPKWIASIGVSTSDAINLNLNRTVLRLTWIMLFLTAVGLMNLGEPLYKLIKQGFPDSISISETTVQQSNNSRSEKQSQKATQNYLPQEKGRSPVRVRALQSVPTVTK